MWAPTFRCRYVMANLSFWKKLYLLEIWDHHLSYLFFKGKAKLKIKKPLTVPKMEKQYLQMKMGLGIR